MKTRMCVRMCKYVLLMLWGCVSVYTVTPWGRAFLMGTKHKSLQEKSLTFYSEDLHYG